jgi:hypothetical protein
MEAMTISLTYRDLKKLALDQAVVKGDVTIKLGPALLSKLDAHPRDPRGSVMFFLDESHPDAPKVAAEPM